MFILIFHFPFFPHYTGKHCSSYRPLQGQCQQIVNGTAQLWRTVDCYCPFWKYECCSSWCKQFAKCLSQTSTWKERCARKFSLFRSGFTITTTAIRNESYPRNFKVKYCGWRPWRRIFSIKITLLHSGPGNITNGL